MSLPPYHYPPSAPQKLSCMRRECPYLHYLTRYSEAGNSGDNVREPNKGHYCSPAAHPMVKAEEDTVAPAAVAALWLMEYGSRTR